MDTSQTAKVTYDSARVGVEDLTFASGQAGYPSHLAPSLP